jgi:transcription elongation factor Elf1
MFEEFSFETREMLSEAVSRYGERDVALVMARAEGLTHEQIAQKIGRSRSRAQQLVERAIRRMRRCGNDYFPELEEKLVRHKEYYRNRWIHGFAICDVCGKKFDTKAPKSYRTFDVVCPWCKSKITLEV